MKQLKTIHKLHFYDIIKVPSIFDITYVWGIDMFLYLRGGFFKSGHREVSINRGGHVT